MYEVAFFEHKQAFLLLRILKKLVSNVIKIKFFSTMTEQ